MDIIYHKSLKMRKLHSNCDIFSAFQSTILRTFFELTKFFLKIGKKFTKTNSFCALAAMVCILKIYGIRMKPLSIC